MRRGRFFIGVTTLMAAGALLTASAAAGANSRQIYTDYADNGRLDRTYSSGQLRSALKDAWVQGYGNPSVLVGVKPAVHTVLRSSSKRAPVTLAAQSSKSPLSSTQRARTLPFTGFDLGLLFAGGAALLLVGGGLRRVTREKG